VKPRRPSASSVGARDRSGGADTPVREPGTLDEVARLAGEWFERPSRPGGGVHQHVTVADTSSHAGAARAPLVRRMLTGPGEDPFELVGWCRRSVQITDRDGTVAFACDEVRSSRSAGRIWPSQWSPGANFASEPEERSARALIERVVEAIAGWAQDAGHARDIEERATLRDELAAPGHDPAGDVRNARMAQRRLWRSAR